MQNYITQIAQQAKAAFYELANADSAAKNFALLRLAELIGEHESALLAANAQDIELAKQKKFIRCHD